MPKLIDITGKKYGTLTVISQGPSDNTKTNTRWWCDCECGRRTLVSKTALPNARSCGCLAVKLSTEAKITHGHSRRGRMTGEYQTWQGMNQRCDNLDDPWYGSQGITVCDRWRYGENGIHGYDCFLADMGKKPAGMEIDRKDVLKGYSPDNCRWVSKQQNANNKRNNVKIEFNGEIRTLTEWSRLLGISTYKVRRLIGIKIVQ